MSAASKPRTVVLAVTGGIAAYKACEVVRRLRDQGVEVRVAMSRAATRFVGPLTFAALSGHPVISDLWAEAAPEQLPHVRWAEACDLLCVAPATADFVAKMAHGVADDFPSTLHLAVAGPVLVAPAMEDDMFRHPSVQRNLETLRRRGVHVLGPATGALASGRSGPGRMVEAHEIVDASLGLLEADEQSPWLEGSTVLVTAGPTREAIDPIRFLSNRSSGRMGYALAVAARDLGATVHLVSGPTGLPHPHGVEVNIVESAAEMAAVVLEAAADADFAVMSAAVADFTVPEPAAEKLKKGDAGMRLELERTTDILAAIGARQQRPLLVGFAAETEDLESRARSKLEAKGCDLIVANDVRSPGVGMGADDNAVIILDRLGGRSVAGPASKRAIATAVWRAVADFRARAS